MSISVFLLSEFCFSSVGKMPSGPTCSVRPLWSNVRARAAWHLRSIVSIFAEELPPLVQVCVFNPEKPTPYVFSHEKFDRQSPHPCQGKALKKFLHRFRSTCHLTSVIYFLLRFIPGLVLCCLCLTSSTAEDCLLPLTAKQWHWKMCCVGGGGIATFLVLVLAVRSLMMLGDTSW